MKKTHIRLAAIILIFSTLFSCAAQPVVISKKNFDTLSNCTVAVFLPFSIGSGVIINEDTVITCKHVVTDHQGNVFTSVIKVLKSTNRMNSDGAEIFTIHEGVVEKVSTKYDLAMIRITKQKFEKKNFVDISLAAPKFDDVVYYSGFLPEMGPYKTRGYFNAQKVMDKRSCIQMNLPITQGISGGGLFNDEMKLIGIVRAHHKTNNSISLAETSENLINFLHDID